MSSISQFIGGDQQYWVSGTTYALGKTVRSPTDHQRYVRVVAGAGTTDPANDTTSWWPDGGRAIKSVQRGTITISNGGTSGTATVSAVNPAKAELRFHGGFGRNSGGDMLIPTITLTNSTTVTASPGGVVAGVMSVNWELTEHH
jgi:hypothetical protein